MAGSPRDPGINVETLERLKWKLSIGKHELGPLWPLPSFSRGHGGVKNGRFWGQNQVTMARSPRDPGITLKLFNASNHIYMKRKTWFRASMTPAILLPCAWGIKNGRFWGQNQVTMAGSPFSPGHEWRGQNMVDFWSHAWIWSETKMSSWTPILRHCVALPNLTGDFFVCHMPEYGQKRKCPPGH